MTLVMRNKHGSGDNSIEFTAGSDLALGDLLLANDAGQVVPISGSYSNEPSIYDITSHLDFATDTSLYKIAVVNKHVVVIALDTVKDLIAGWVGKMNADGSITWGSPSTLATGDFADLRLISVPSENMCAYSGILNNNLYIGLVVIDFAALTVKSSNFTTRGGQVAQGYELFLHPGENRVVSIRDSAGSLYAESFAVSGQSLASAGNTLIQHGHNSTKIKALYCSHIDRVLIIYRHTADSNRPYYILCAFASGVPAVTKAGTRLSMTAFSSSSLDLSYDAQAQRVLFLAYPMAHVLNVTATNVELGVKNTSIVDLNYIQSARFDPVNNVHSIVKSKPNELIVERALINASDNTFSIESSASKAVSQGSISSQYDPELDVEVVASKSTTKGIDLYFASMSTAVELSKLIIGFASQAVSAGGSLDVTPVSSPTYIVETTQNVSPTETYYVSYDNKLQMTAPAKFVDGLVGIKGYAIGSNELVVNK